jgi:hypothetical protein
MKKRFLFPGLILLVASLACTLSTAVTPPAPLTLTPAFMVAQGAGLSFKISNDWQWQGDSSHLVLTKGADATNLNAPPDWRIQIVALIPNPTPDAATLLAGAVPADPATPDELISAPTRVKVGNAQGVGLTVRVNENDRTFFRRTIIARTPAHAYRIELESPEALWGSFQDSFETLSAGFQFP